MKTTLAVTVTVLVVVCQAAVKEDEIKMLPGLVKQPTFKQYSGYLKASGTKKLHYWFTESQNKPDKDPVVLWMNGGPGCSSDLGLLTENGPFRIMPNGRTVVYSNTSWNMIANMLFLEAPAGVGYSYAGDKNYTTDDDEVARDNHLALQDFFSKYPEYSKNEFFITGESYGGIYVPTLSSLVVDDKSINFKGMAIGNGLSNSDMNDNSLIYFAYFHGLIGDNAWKDLNKFCCGSDTQRCYFTEKAQDPQCEKVLSAVMSLLYSSGLNIYNLYGECAGGVMTRYNKETDMYDSSNFGYPLGFMESVRFDRMKMRGLAAAGKLNLDPPCIDAKNVEKYMNWDMVRTALHIPGFVQKWETCSSVVGTHYHRIYNDMSKQYKKVLSAGKRVLVYNGDIDMACNFLGDEWFVNGLGLKIVTERKEWFYKAEDGTRQVAGFVKTFPNFSLVTVKGAGHMVPTDKPIPGFLMFSSFLKNSSLPGRFTSGKQ